MSRLPLLTPADLDISQTELYNSLVSNEIIWANQSGFQAIDDRGRLLGPFNAMLFQPLLGRKLLDLFHAEKNSENLTPKEHEIIILTVGAQWNSAYELYSHIAVAKKIGLPEKTIEEIISNSKPEFETTKEELVYNICLQLTNDYKIDTEVYNKAKEYFDEKTLVNIVILIGLYLAVCSLINAFEIDVPIHPAGNFTL